MTEKSTISTPLAIVIAGALIAVAIYASNVRKPSTSVPDPNLAAGTTPPIAEPTVGPFRPVSEKDHVRGPANAKVTIIEYSDLECPFCKRFHITMQQVVEEYPNDVRWVYRHFPLTQLHQQADDESYAAECAGEQGKFWEFIDLVYAETPSNDGLDLAKLPTYAQQAGVANIPQFQSCVDSQKYKDVVDADYADAGSAGGQGTPYSIAVGQDGTAIPINGAQPYEQVKATIDSLL